MKLTKPLIKYETKRNLTINIPLSIKLNNKMFYLYIFYINCSLYFSMNVICILNIVLKLYNVIKLKYIYWSPLWYFFSSFGVKKRWQSWLVVESATFAILLTRCLLWRFSTILLLICFSSSDRIHSFRNRQLIKFIIILINNFQTFFIPISKHFLVRVKRKGQKIFEFQSDIWTHHE